MIRFSTIRLLAGGLCCWLWIALAFAAVPVWESDAPLPALSAEEEARLTSRLDDLFRGDAESAGRRAATEGRSAPICATMALRDLALQWNRLSPSARRTYAPLLSRPTESYASGLEIPTWGSQGAYTASRIATTRFIVHYVSDPPTHPDYATAAFAQQVSDVLNHVATVQNTQLGWPPPPPDDNYPAAEDNGGDERYDVYLGDCGAKSLFGYVMPEYYVTGAPGAAATSFMVLDNNYTDAVYGGGNPLEYLKVTVAHEYNHACQYALNVNDPETWFYETTATHLEDLVYNDINDYLRFLPYFFNAPAMGLRTYNGHHEYASTIWNHYLHRRFGPDIILKIWEDTATGGFSHPTLLQATQSRLITEASSLADEFGRFAAWNYLTGTRADTLYYPESGAWPEMLVADGQAHETYPLANPSPLTLAPQQLAASYIRLPVPESSAQIRFEFQGGSGTSWRLWFVGRKDETSILLPVALDANARGLAVLDDAHAYSWMVFVPSTVSASGSIGPTYSFTYSASAETTLAASPLYLELP